MDKIKKVAAIHDLSGVGRCSLTVILPILSAMGVQVCPVPTAILSTHTGGFGAVEMRDLTDYISPALSHYKSLGFNFDCVYSGFLASQEQIDHCLEFYSQYRNSFKVVDPVMGDNGKPYKTYTPQLCGRMKELVKIADLITPNLTESAILLSEQYPTGLFTVSMAKSWLTRLSELGPDMVIITGVTMTDGKYNIGFEKNHSSFWKVKCDYVPVHYPGTGDVFSAVTVGGILKGDSLPIAMDRATEFTELAVKTTYSYSADAREGIMLEACLGWLTDNRILSNYSPL